MLQFVKESIMPCSAQTLFDWHESPHAFRALLPPGEPVTVVHHDGHIRNGARAVILVGHWPLRIRWELMHEDYIAGKQFCDVQMKGPFRSYRHEHIMTDTGPGHCILLDRITFEMPFGCMGACIGRHLIMKKFSRLFDFRHDVTLRAISHDA